MKLNISLIRELAAFPAFFVEKFLPSFALTKLKTS